ncbi:MAG: flagellar basal body P-ring formation chaperone FlgA [Burkholderiaceae bacterium]|nr:flagellar basal body P-ring formation chaperone FlgA [Burkholderiaceae bacterium]
MLAQARTTLAQTRTTLAQKRTTLAQTLGTFAALGFAASTVAVAAQQAPNAAQHAAAMANPPAVQHAPARPSSDDASPLAEMAPQLQRWIEESAASTWMIRLPAGADSGATDGADGDVGAAGLRVEVKVGRLNRGMRLAPCARIEPFLPPNARLWGRGFVGVRCTEGATWSTMIPVTVSVFGPALVANLPLPAGSMPSPGDFRIDEVDWTRTTGVPVTDPAWLAGRSLARPLSAGQVLRANDLRVPQTIAAGDPVRIRMVGTGFSVSASGFALAGAGEGQSLRVRTESGRMLVGTVRERTVEIRL